MPMLMLMLLFLFPVQSVWLKERKASYKLVNANSGHKNRRKMKTKMPQNLL